MKIYVVDDDPMSREMAVACLDIPHVITREFAAAAELLAAVAAEAPDLILLDIEMPGMDGIDACRALRAADQPLVQVIFVSAHNDLATRLTAYDAGGNDFIVKPYEPVELKRKVGVARQFAADRDALLAQSREAQRTAFAAMSSMGEMGVVLEFLRAFSSIDTPEQLAARLLEAPVQFGLDGFVELRTAQGRMCHSRRGICTPLECSILEHASGMDRVFQFRDRLIINYPNVTLILQALPLDDPDRVGRLRDNLALIVEAADVRLQSMETARRQLAQASGIGDAVAELTRTLDEIDKMQTTHRLRANEIDEQFLHALNNAYVHLGLSDSQETTLTELVQQTHGQLNALRDEDSDISDRLRGVVRQLQKLAVL